jgi:hypothetical protein
MQVSSLLFFFRTYFLQWLPLMTCRLLMVAQSLEVVQRSKAKVTEGSIEISSRSLSVQTIEGSAGGEAVAVTDARASGQMRRTRARTTLSAVTQIWPRLHIERLLCVGPLYPIIFGFNYFQTDLNRRAVEMPDGRFTYRTQQITTRRLCRWAVDGGSNDARVNLELNARGDTNGPSVESYVQQRCEEN